MAETCPASAFPSSTYNVTSHHVTIKCYKYENCSYICIVCNPSDKIMWNMLLVVLIILLHVKLLTPNGA